MSLLTFPVPVSTSSSGAKSLVAASPNVLYVGTNDFQPGTYTLTCISSTVMTYHFLNGNTSVATGSTSSGTVTINLASPATRVLIYTNTGTNIIGTLTLVASTIAPVSGNVETITSSGTYNLAGAAYVVVVGAGQGAGYQVGGTGGAVTGAFISLDGTPQTVVIGASGAGGATNPNVSAANSSPGNGGSSSFGNITAAGGGSGGSPGNSPYNFVVSGSNGNGQTPNAAANGSGIGTGGNYSGSYNGNGGGYGAGGGYSNIRGGGITCYGGSGGQGIVYVVRV